VPRHAFDFRPFASEFQSCVQINKPLSGFLVVEEDLLGAFSASVVHPD
jgi:hypothetical protein